MSPILGIVASQNYSRTPTTGFVSIATQTVGSGGASSVTFSNIPQVYTHLQIRCIARTNRVSTSDNLYIRVGNGTVDSSANYPGHRLSASNGTVSATAFTTADGLTGMISGATAASSNTANVFGASVIDILDYKNTSKNKTARTLSGMDTNGSGSLFDFISAVWLSTSAINIITILPINGTSFNQYSSFALYGIQGA